VRECPKWFQEELTRIGGINQYGEPIFKLIWSLDHRMTVGGKWADGFIGYRTRCPNPDPCWMLMVWEPAEVQGSFEAWDRDFRDGETGLLECGGYPKYGKYRVLQRFIHIDIVQQAEQKSYMSMSGEPMIKVIRQQETRTYRMEPRGLILDLMLPLLMMWRRLSDAAKLAAIREREQEKKDEYAKAIKDSRAGFRIRRGSQLVQKRAEMMEKGMRQAMAIASRSGLGMKVTQI
jgi:hypothetical protein